MTTDFWLSHVFSVIYVLIVTRIFLEISARDTLPQNERHSLLCVATIEFLPRSFFHPAHNIWRTKTTCFIQSWTKSAFMLKIQQMKNLSVPCVLLLAWTTSSCDHPWSEQTGQRRHAVASKFPSLQQIDSDLWPLTIRQQSDRIVTWRETAKARVKQSFMRRAAARATAKRHQTRLRDDAHPAFDDILVYMLTITRSYKMCHPIVSLSVVLRDIVTTAKPV